MASQWAVRAREHFDSHTYKVNGVESKYNGASNTINIWQEEPYQWSYGLALGPVIGSGKRNSAGEGLGSEIHLMYGGLEGKYFLLTDYHPYIRLGAYYHELDIAGPNNPTGFGYSVGIGYEFKTKHLGIAIEAAIRKVSLSDNVEGTIFTPSIGFHFYDMIHL
jgi:hypothetical protein